MLINSTKTEFKNNKVSEKLGEIPTSKISKNKDQKVTYIKLEDETLDNNNSNSNNIINSNITNNTKPIDKDSSNKLTIIADIPTEKKNDPEKIKLTVISNDNKEKNDNDDTKDINENIAKNIKSDTNNSDNINSNEKDIKEVDSVSTKKAVKNHSIIIII